MDFIKGSEKQQRDLIELLQRAFPNVQLNLYDNEDYSFTYDRLLRSGGSIYGFIKKGEVFLDAGRINLNSPLHEYSHIWVKALKIENNNLYLALLEKIYQEQHLINEKRSDPNYSNLTLDEMADEVLADLVGDKGSLIIAEGLQGANPGLWQGIQQDVNNIWSWVKNRFSKESSSIRNWNIEKFKSSTLNEVIDGVTKDLLSGNEISKLSSKELAQDNSLLFQTTDQQLQQIKNEALANGTFMKAPNGKPTNLNERQWIQTRTPEFKQWFGDWERDPDNASKVVDENGEPLVVFHGGIKGISEFYASGMSSRGANFFTSNKDLATKYARGEEVYEVFLDMKEPTINDASGKTYSQWTDATGGWGNSYLPDAEIIVRRLKDSVSGIDKKTKNSDVFVVGNNLNSHIKSATNNIGKFSSIEPDIRYQIIGEKGAKALDKYQESTQRIENLTIAKEMEAAGRDPISIRLATGWEKGVDGLWRYEVGEGDFIAIKYSLSEIMDHDIKLSEIWHDTVLFDAYPELANINIRIDNYLEGGGEFIPSQIYQGIHTNSSIKVNLLQSVGKEGQKRTVIHEIQHAIQQIEGFAKGSDLNQFTKPSDIDVAFKSFDENIRLFGHDKYAIIGNLLNNKNFEGYLTIFINYVNVGKLLVDQIRKMYTSLDKETFIDHYSQHVTAGGRGSEYEQYFKTAGEVEARNVSARMNLTPEERLNFLLSQTADVAPEDQIIIHQGIGRSLSIIGEKGAVALDNYQESTYRIDNLTIAKKMDVSGRDPLTIRQATGWEKGVDGLWRYEVADIDVIPVPENMISIKLDKLINDSELFTAYPELRKIYVSKGNSSYYDKKLPVIRISSIQKIRDFEPEYNRLINDIETHYVNLQLNGELTPEAEKILEEQYNEADKKMAESAVSIIFDKDILTHEIQHAIQEIEGFSKGGNVSAMIRYSIEESKILFDSKFSHLPSYNEAKRNGTLDAWVEKMIGATGEGLTPREAYHRLSGEVEARNAETRLTMSPEERRNTLLSQTADVAPEDQIILRNSLGLTSRDDYNSSPIKSSIGNQEVRSKTEQFDLDPTDDIESLERNIAKILYQYSGRTMAAIQVEGYLNEFPKIGKQYLKKYGITKREELKIKLGKLQSRLRAGKGKERNEFIKEMEHKKTEQFLSNIEKMALVAEAEMQVKIDSMDLETYKTTEITDSKGQIHSFNRIDVLGNKILTPDQWNGLSKQEQDKRKSTITREITDPHTGVKFEVDYNLAEALQKILNAGFATGQSDSGTISDHPGYRYVADSKTGKYHKGECIPPGSGSYLTFWKPQAKAIEELGRNINTQEKIDQIRAIAADRGFVCQDTNVFYQPSIRLSLPYTNDGQSHQAILGEASEKTNKDYPGLYDRDFWKWLDLRDELYLPLVIDQHGGEKQYTDQQVIQLWDNLAKGLEQSQKQNITVMNKYEQKPAVGEKKSFEKIDFKKFKREISLPDFLIENFGFQPDAGSSSHYPKLKNDNTGEVLVIKKNHEGYYTYFNVHDDRVKGCSIFDFMQDRLSKEDSAGRKPSLVTVAQVLEGYKKSGKIVAPDDSKFYVESSLWNAETNYKDVKQLRPIVTNEFLKGRGFSKETLENPLFKGVFFERDYNKDGNIFTNTALKLYNLSGLSGLSQRNDNFKGCLGNRFDSLACSMPNNEKKYTKLFVGESFLDCVAHFEINKDRLKNESIAYFSSEGAITSGQIVLLDKFIERNKPEEFISIFDRDLAGVVYDLKLLSELKSYANSIEMTLHEDKENKQIFLYLSDKIENKDHFISSVHEKFNPTHFEDLQDNPGIEISELISNDTHRISLQVIIPREFEFALRSTNIINELRFEEKEIKIEKSFSNDFNDDLKALKTERGTNKNFDLVQDHYKTNTRTNNINYGI